MIVITKLVQKIQWMIRERIVNCTISATSSVIAVCRLAKPATDCTTPSTPPCITWARELLNDYYRVGDQVWLRFSAGREVLDYMHQLSDAFAGEFKSPMTAELAATVSELERLAEVSGTEDQSTDTIA